MTGNGRHYDAVAIVRHSPLRPRYLAILVSPSGVGGKLFFDALNTVDLLGPPTRVSPSRWIPMVALGAQ